MGSEMCIRDSSRHADYYRMGSHPIYEVWCAVDQSNYPASYTYRGNYSYYTVCEYDWDGNGYDELWRYDSFTLYGELDWGLESYSQLPTWIGGDGVSELPLYVRGIDPGIQYRVVLYFELVSIVNFVE